MHEREHHGATTSELLGEFSLRLAQPHIDNDFTPPFAAAEPPPAMGQSTKSPVSISSASGDAHS
jgi:hypothetical protein